MASDLKHPPPYTIPVEPSGDKVKVYHVHTPFNPASPTPVPQVYTSGGGGLSSGFDTGKKNVTSYDTALGFNSGMTTCPSCQQQVMTNVAYKPGMYSWLMVCLFICLGLVACCCLIPLLVKQFKDAHHTCPRCNRLLHVEKRKCCK
ncbi:lITAF domain-containing protein [Stigmatopora nigra]